MIGKLKRSLAWRMAFSFGAIVTVSLLISAVVSFFYEKRDIQQDVLGRQAIFREIQKERLQEYFTERAGMVRLHAKSLEISQILAYTNEAQAAGSGGATEENSSRRYGLMAQKAHKKLSADIHDEGFEELLILASDALRILYASREGLGVPSGDRAEKRAKALAPVWKSALKEMGVVFGDMVYYEPAGGPCFFIAVPVMEEAGVPMAVVVAAISPGQLKHIIEARAGLGVTGDTYVVGQDGVLRTPSRFLGDTDVLKKRVDTEAVRRAVAGEVGQDIIVDYRGTKVISTYTPIGLSEVLHADTDWALLVETDVAEAFSAVHTLIFRYAVLTVILALSGVLLGFVTARGMIRPIRELITAIHEVTQGNLKVSIEGTSRTDEVGELSRGFSMMLEFLKRQTHQVMDGVNHLAASISQISATAAQLAASSAETATSISEITATVEEVRQSARLSHDKGKQVAEKSELLAHISQEGRRATGDVLGGLQRIREEMDFVAESVMRLSDQGQSIGDIIDVVRDLADQVNLLSVNAAIEAAKAGEHGKGFAVVAQEMRSLADQSKEATEQVKQILSEIQKATSSAVMAIERGTKAVAAGLELGQRTGEAIERLGQGVEEASDSALQIASSSQEQVVGMEQLVLAVQNIREASAQNTEGARQLEGAVRDLERLSVSLREVSSHLRV